MNSGLRYLGGMALIVVALMGALHVLTSAAVALYASYYYQERMFDIREHGNTLESIDLAGGYIGSKVDGSTVVAVGSSVTFGYPFDVAWTMPGQLNRKGIKTTNVSVIGLGMQGISHWLLCPMAARGIRPKAIIIEIPLINEMSWLPKAIAPKTGPCPSPQGTGGLFRTSLRILTGFEWVHVLRDNYRGSKPPERITLTKVPDDYFATVEDFRRVAPAFRENIEQLYTQATTISDTVLVYVSPVYLDGLHGLTDQDDSVREQFASVQAMCHDVAKHGCVDVTDIAHSPRYFANLTHPNTAGAESLATLMGDRLVQNTAQRR